MAHTPRTHPSWQTYNVVNQDTVHVRRRNDRGGPQSPGQGGASTDDVNQIATEVGNTASSNTTSWTVTQANTTNLRAAGGLAQSFTPVSPLADAGIFLTGVDLFFAKKATYGGITVKLVEMRMGVPDTNEMISYAYLPYSSIGASLDGSVATRFNFLHPTFVTTDIEYAIILEGPSDFTVWTGEIGEYDIITGAQISTNLYSGNMFVSGSTTGGWTLLATEDLKFIMYRAKFTVSQAYAFFYNDWDEYLTVSSIAKANSGDDPIPGDMVITPTALVINVVSITSGGTGYTNGTALTFSNGGQVNAATVTITTNTTGGITSFTYTNRGSFYYAPTISVSGGTGANLVAVLNTAAKSLRVSTNTAEPMGQIKIYDQPNNYILVGGSGGYFANDLLIEIHRPDSESNTSTINASSVVANAVVVEAGSLEYHAIIPGFLTLRPNKTNLEYEFKGTNNTFTLDSAYTQVDNDIEHEFFDQSRIVTSRTREVTSMANAKSAMFRVNFTTNSPYVSPVIDFSKRSFLATRNIINNDLTNEHTRLGNAIAKYLTGTITLADGMEAEDIIVWVSAWRPVNTDVTVYVKFLNNEDPAPFDDKLWTKMTPRTGEFMYSDPLVVTDYRDLEYHIPTVNAYATSAFVNSSSGIMEYYDAAGSRYLGYKYFAIKVVMTSDNSVIVPRLDDCRAIALQV